MYDEKTTETTESADLDDLERRLADLDRAEKAVDSAYATGKVDRANITKAAQLDAAEAVAMVGVAMEADVEADEAMKIPISPRKWLVGSKECLLKILL